MTKEPGKLACPSCEEPLDAETLHAIKNTPDGISCPLCDEIIRWDRLRVLR